MPSGDRLKTQGDPRCRKTIVADLGEASAIRWPVLRRTYAVVRD